MNATDNARSILNSILTQPNATPEQRTALALTGLLSAVVETFDREDREGRLTKLHDTADAALGRVLELADTLDAHPHATLKPTAFGDLANKIRAAVDDEETA